MKRAYKRWKNRQVTLSNAKTLSKHAGTSLGGQNPPVVEIAEGHELHLLRLPQVYQQQKKD